MKEFELRAPNPAFHAAVDAGTDSARDMAANIMRVTGELIEKAIETILKVVPPEDVELCLDHTDAHRMVILVRGTPTYEVTTDLLSVDVTVTGDWLVWPPIEPDATE